jgi:Tfp pilus assembly protein PilZ
VSPTEPLATTDEGADPDRREFFRVEDRVNLRHRRIERDALALPAESHFDNSEVFWLMRELRTVDIEHHSRLRGLSEHDRELGLYLKGINRKIELVAGALAALDRMHSGVSPQPVLLSEGGLSFHADADFTIGDLLVLQLTLLPEHLGLALYGEVTSVDTARRRVGIGFLRLREADRQILARHILQVQIAARRHGQDAETT